MTGRKSGYLRGGERLFNLQRTGSGFDRPEVGSRLPIKLLAISGRYTAVDRKSWVGFRLGVLAWVPILKWKSRWLPKAEVVFRIFFSRRKWLSRKVFPVLIDYPELRPTRRAQYETAILNDGLSLLLYCFYRKGRRGLAQAPREKGGGAKTGSNLAELVLTGFL